MKIGLFLFILLENMPYVFCFTAFLFATLKYFAEYFSFYLTQLYRMFWNNRNLLFSGLKVFKFWKVLLQFDCHLHQIFVIEKWKYTYSFKKFSEIKFSFLQTCILKQRNKFYLIIFLLNYYKLKIINYQWIDTVIM